MRPARHAALLLEVVVALTVLVAAIGLLGAQLVGSLNTIFYSEEQLRASLLADRVLALVQMDPDMQRRLAEEDDFEDLFGKEYPGYYWHIHTEPLERDKPDELKVVTIQVFYQPDKQLHEDLAGINTATMLRQLALFKGKPGTINLVEQAGLSEEAAEELRQAIPIAGFDPAAIDLQQLMATLTNDQIMQLIPMLMPLLQQIASGQLPADLQGLAEQISGTLGPDTLGGLSAEDLANTIQQAVGGGGRPAAAGGALSPGPAGRSPATPGRTPGAGGRTPGGNPAAPPAKPPASPPASGGRANIGSGSGPNGEYTLEDLMRMRDEYERQQGGRK
jgi:hypothetical protein